jgi:hypothetical protein
LTLRECCGIKRMSHDCLRGLNFVQTLRFRGV